MKKSKTLVATHILFVFALLCNSGRAKTNSFEPGNIEDEFLVDSLILTGQQASDREFPNPTQGLNYFESKGSNQSARQGSSQPSAERKIRVVVDPGHGGKDVGAKGINGILEKELCLKVSRFVRREIERYSKVSGVPIEVKLSRDVDEFVPLKERAKFANVWGADLFVSIHANSSPAVRAKGFEVYFLSPEATDEEASKLARLENQAPPTPISAQVISILSDATTQYHVAESSQLAEFMYSSVSQRISSNARGVRQAPFTVLHGTNMPAVLVEIGYVTNFEDSKNLTKEGYLKRIASAISSGIIDFATQKRK